MPRPFEVTVHWDDMECGYNVEKEHMRFSAMYPAAPVTSRIAKGSSHSQGPHEDQSRLWERKHGWDRATEIASKENWGQEVVGGEAAGSGTGANAGSKQTHKHRRAQSHEDAYQDNLLSGTS